MRCAAIALFIVFFRLGNQRRLDLAAAKEYMDEEVIESPVSYPDDETLARSESFAELGIEATQTMNDLWLSVKTEGANTTLYLALTIAAVAAVIAFFLISAAVTRRKKARRCRKWRETQ